MASEFEGMVYVVDDDAGVLDAVEEMVRGAGLRAKCFREAGEFLRCVSDSDPGCVVLDVRLADRDGLEVLELLKARRCRLPTIVITGYGDVPMAVRAMKLGALTFLEKPIEPKELLDEISKAVSVVRLRARATYLPELPNVELTGGERRIISCLMRGLTDAEMATEFDVSRRTLRLWKKDLFSKCGVTSRRQLLEQVFEARACS
ncbi:MAG TPA: response regulator [Planctomycetaceae bacterium]|nr:response regulator [Planctomycetaceae bacterium]